MSQQLSPRALNPWRSLRRRLGAVLGRRPRTRGRLRLEQLEDRTVPTLAVTEVSVINSLGSSNVGSKANLNGTLIFAADDGVHGTELWTSDGTAAGAIWRIQRPMKSLAVSGASSEAKALMPPQKAWPSTTMWRTFSARTANSSAALVPCCCVPSGS